MQLSSSRSRMPVHSKALEITVLKPHHHEYNGTKILIHVIFVTRSPHIIRAPHFGRTSASCIECDIKSPQLKVGHQEVHDKRVPRIHRYTVLDVRDTSCTFSSLEAIFHASVPGNTLIHYCLNCCICYCIKWYRMYRQQRPFLPHKEPQHYCTGRGDLRKPNLPHPPIPRV